MQKVTRDMLVSRAAELMAEGKVSRVLGWAKGEFDYDITPAVFSDEKKLREDFVWNSFSGANLSKYLVKKAGKNEGKLLVFLKPCDSYSFNELLTEHRFCRDDVYAIGVACEGMVDIRKIRNKAGEGISEIEDKGDVLIVHTMYADEPVKMAKNDVLTERCVNCKSKKHVAFDEIIGETGENKDPARFAEVEKLERMTAEERYQFWQKELSRCIRCNACRDVCPACTCEKCVFDNAASGVESRTDASFEEQVFHIIRAYHVAGRCTDCGECSRVCPENIPLHLLNRKFIKDINEFYGEYQAGSEVGQRAPLTDHTKDDIEPAKAFEGRSKNA